MTCVPNKYCYALVTTVLMVNGYMDDAYHRRIEAGFQFKIDVRNKSGNLSAFCSYYKQICIFLQTYAIHPICTTHLILLKSNWEEKYCVKREII